jgi:hypothetical protein
MSVDKTLDDIQVVREKYTRIVIKCPEGYLRDMPSIHWFREPMWGNMEQAKKWETEEDAQTTARRLMWHDERCWAKRKIHRLKLPLELKEVTIEIRECPS